jgi:hypothetical protein
MPTSNHRTPAGFVHGEALKANSRRRWIAEIRSGVSSRDFDGVSNRDDLFEVKALQSALDAPRPIGLNSCKLCNS